MGISHNKDLQCRDYFLWQWSLFSSLKLKIFGCYNKESYRNVKSKEKT